MFDLHQPAEQAILVHITLPQEHAREDLDELRMLVSSAGVHAATVVTGPRQTIDARLFVGSGKAQ